MRVVLDTNVLMSGILFGGPPGRILDAWATDRIQLVASPEILEEYRRVAGELARKYPQVALQPVLDVLTAKCEICRAGPLSEQICRDASDDKFLACAEAAGVSILVSGDEDLLEVSGYQGIEVVKPRAFVGNYLEEDE